MENVKDIKKFSFVIAAGGSGSRMGGKDLKKQFRLLDNRQVWRWSADLAAGLDSEKFKICEIVLVLPEEDFNLINIDDWNKNIKLKLVAGGNSRPESVLNGLNACSCDYVMIHDAARPFLTREIILMLAGAVDEDTGAIPVIPVSDAIKHIEKINEDEKITHLNRDKLFITQTPQVFYRPRLIEIIKKHGMEAKDEAEAWLDAGFKIKTVNGDRLNFKITVPADWEIARALINLNDDDNKMKNLNITRTGLGLSLIHI